MSVCSPRAYVIVHLRRRRVRVLPPVEVHTSLRLTNTVTRARRGGSRESPSYPSAETPAKRSNDIRGSERLKRRGAVVAEAEAVTRAPTPLHYPAVCRRLGAGNRGCCTRVAGHDRTSAHLEVEGVRTESDRTEITWCK